VIVVVLVVLLLKDKSYVERLEKEFLDAREELSDLRGILNDVASGSRCSIRVSCCVSTNVITQLLFVCLFVCLFAVKNELSATLRGGERTSANAQEIVGVLDVDAAIALLDDAPPSHAPPDVDSAATSAQAAARREMVDSFLD
jgi:hypothetical protein